MASTPRSLARSSGGRACQRASTAPHEDASGSTRVGGTRRLTANGRSVAPRMARISSRRSSGRKLTPPRQPRPARFADRGDERCLRHSGHARGRDGVLDAQELGEGRPHADRSPISAPGRSGRPATPACRRVLGGEPRVQLRPHVRQPRRFGSRPRGGDQVEVEIGDDHALGAGVLVLGDDAVVEPERPVDRCRDERRARPVDGPVGGYPAAADEGRGDDEELVLEGAGVGGVADPLRAPAVPGQRRAEDQVDPVEGQVPADLRELDVGADLDRDGGRTDPRDEHLVARGRAHRLLLRREVELVLPLDAAVRVREERGVPVGAVGRPPVVAAAEDGQAVGRRQLAQHVGEGLDAGREDPPVGRRHVRDPQRRSVGIRGQQPGAGQLGEHDQLGAGLRRPADDRGHVGGEVLEVGLGPQLQLHRGDPQHGGHGSTSAPAGARSRATTSVRCTFPVCGLRGSCSTSTTRDGTL